MSRELSHAARIVLSDAPFDRRYHVPRSQVWEGSRGRQAGKVHVHALEAVSIGRIHREPGQALCGRSGWYERLPYPDEPSCPRCEEILVRYSARSGEHG